MALVHLTQIATQYPFRKSWWYQQAERNALPHLRVGKYVMFDEEDIRAFFEACKRGPGILPTPEAPRPRPAVTVARLKAIEHARQRKFERQRRAKQIKTSPTPGTSVSSR